jgi:hypothetical protein
MALGKRKREQQELLMATTSLPQSPGHPFYEKLNRVLAEAKSAVYGNRRRVRGKRGKALGRLRSEYTERSFAHTCETGGARRSRLRGLIDVAKRYLMYVAGRNLGVIMRAIFGIGTPKSLQTEGEASPCAVFAWLATVPPCLRRRIGVLVIYLTHEPDRAAPTPVTCAA